MNNMQLETVDFPPVLTWRTRRKSDLTYDLWLRAVRSQIQDGERPITNLTLNIVDQSTSWSDRRRLLVDYDNIQRYAQLT